MPTYLIYGCAQCGAETEKLPYGTMPPREWINIVIGGVPDWFDKWECVAIYASAKNEDVPAEAGATQP